MKLMSSAWFRRSGRLLIPVSYIGWLVYVAAVVGCIYIFNLIDTNSGSLLETIGKAVVPWAVILAAAYGVAWFTSIKR